MTMSTQTQTDVQNNVTHEKPETGARPVPATTSTRWRDVLVQNRDKLAPVTDYTLYKPDTTTRHVSSPTVQGLVSCNIYDMLH